MKKRIDIIDTARYYLGCCERDHTHKPIIDIYNTIVPLPRKYKLKYTDAWCAAFVSAIAKLNDALDIIPPECSCYYMMEAFQNISEWVESDAYMPESGDVIFYDWQDTDGDTDNTGSPDHVGYVEFVQGGKIVTIEGNYNDAVQRRVLDINGKYIRGFGTPHYDDVSLLLKAKSNADIDAIAERVIRGEFGNYPVRKTNIERMGYDYTVVQKRVNQILRGF